MVEFVVIKGPGYEEVIKELTELGTRYTLVSLPKVDEEKIIEELRALPPQVRGRIRYGRGRPLPLTRSGKLNVKNTCILLVYEKEKLVDVYPKMLGRRYIDPVEGVRISFSKTPQYYLYEEPLLTLLSQHPELLGCARVKAVKEKIPLPERGQAEIDLVLEEEDGDLVLVEVEEIVSLNAIAQVLNLTQVYQESTNKKVKRIAVVGLLAEESAKRAARKSSIEIWLLKLVRIQD